MLNALITAALTPLGFTLGFLLVMRFGLSRMR